jgi:hypothetical protein
LLIRPWDLSGIIRAPHRFKRWLGAENLKLVCRIFAVVLGGRLVNFVVLRPPVAVLRQRGIDRLPEEAAYLAGRYGESDHPEAAAFAGRIEATAEGRPVNEFEEVMERGLDHLPHVGLWVDPSGIDPHGVVDLLLDRRAEAAWMVAAGME